MTDAASKAQEIVQCCEHAGLFGDERGACEYCIANAISAAVAEERALSKGAVDLAAEWERQCREARGHALKFAREAKAERERAAKLVDAAKALIEAAHGLNSAVCQEFCLSSDTSHQPGNTCAPKEIAGAEAAVKEYEVPHE